MSDTPRMEPEATAPANTGFRLFLEFPLTALVLGVIAVMAFYMLAAAAMVGIGVAGGGVSFSDTESLEHLPDWLFNLGALLIAISSILAVKLAVRRLGSAPRDDLPFDVRWRDFFKGIALSFVLMSAIVALAALLGGYRLSGWGGSTSAAFLIIVTGFQAGFFEEVLFRGVIFRFLEEFAGSWAAILVSGVLFGLVHYGNANATLLASVAIAVEAGILLAAAYMLTRNLWLAIGIHWGWNVTQGYVWDVPVSGYGGDGLVDAHPAGNELISGGAFGLEASLVALVLATAVGIWMLVKAHRLGHVVRPWWVRRRLGLALPG